MAQYLEVQTTTADQQHAEAIAQTLVERRLAACVQVLGPTKSYYRWQGQVEISHEWLCIIKTEAEKFAAVENAIRELHTYQVPEVIAMPITHGSGDYLSWLSEQM
jgi:periplasmic divalent cation tolerance protein